MGRVDNTMSLFPSAQLCHGSKQKFFAMLRFAITGNASPPQKLFPHGYALPPHPGTSYSWIKRLA
jgi:hypothetical protein